MTRSAIYAGDVVHARMRPRRHHLRYRVFALLVDLDELPVLDRRLRLFGYNRRAPLSFWDADHGDGVGPLRQWVGGLLEKAGVHHDGGRIELLCYPRILGYVFNPLSVYFCYSRRGELVAILHEVHNTHGERHTYVIPVSTPAEVVRHAAPKQFFVSPFMPMDCLYRFRIRMPGEKVGVLIQEDDAEGLLLTAAFTGRRLELSDAALRHQLVSHPLMTFKVVAAIHWEAMKLLLKGMPVFRHARARRRVDAVIVADDARVSVPHHAARHHQPERMGE